MTYAPRHRAYNPRVPETDDLPDDVAGLKRLVREHRLEIERLRIQLARLRRWKFGRSREQLELEVTQIEMSLQRKLPRQGHSLKLDSRAARGLGRKVRGGTRPRLSWGRSSLYSLSQVSVTSRTCSMASNT